MSKGEVTRNRIISQAAPVFNQRGYAGCSMQDILDATGMEKGGVYRHFSSKEELAVEAFRYSWANAVRVRSGDIDPISGAVEKLRYLVRHFVETPSCTPGGCPLMNTAVESDDGNPALRQLARKALREWRKRLERVAAEGIQQGEIRSTAEPRWIANTIIATLEGALMISRLEGSKRPMQDASKSLDLLFRDIKTRKTRVA